MDITYEQLLKVLITWETDHILAGSPATDPTLTIREIARGKADYLWSVLQPTPVLAPTLSATDGQLGLSLEG